MSTPGPQETESKRSMPNTAWRSTCWPSCTPVPPLWVAGRCCMRPCRCPPKTHAACLTAPACMGSCSARARAQPHPAASGAAQQARTTLPSLATPSCCHGRRRPADKALPACTTGAGGPRSRAACVRPRSPQCLSLRRCGGRCGQSIQSGAGACAVPQAPPPDRAPSGRTAGPHQAPNKAVQAGQLPGTWPAARRRHPPT